MSIRSGPRGTRSWPRSASAPPPDATSELAEWIRSEPRGLLVCGPLDEPSDAVQGIAELADAAGWPVVADPLSGLRSSACAPPFPLLAHADLWLRAPCVERIRPRALLRFGRTPTCKSLRLWLERHPPDRVLHVDGDAGFSDASHRADDRWPFDPGELARATRRRLPAGPRRSEWRTALSELDALAGQVISSQLAGEASLLAPQVVRTLATTLPDDALLYASNSMPIRDLDAFWPKEAAPRRILANRGANGIDGVTSSALGAAAAGRGPVVLLTGDLAFLHDLGGLWAATRTPFPA
jgi:2-succinyl-5-enolpyruvyl-6-hydroxy-3-cyclohexene-1-carboxylate synthase